MDKVVLAGLQILKPPLEPLLEALDPLARDAIVIVDARDQPLVAGELVFDQLLFEGCRGGDELERIMGDDCLLYTSPSPRD